jgi:hypothetical protein
MTETESTDKKLEPTNKQLGKATVNLFRIMDSRTRYLKWRMEILENMVLTLAIAFALWLLYEFGVFDVLGEAIWSS